MPGGDWVLFTQHFDPSLPPIQGDQEWLTQVVLNVLRNAVETVRNTPRAEMAMDPKK